jgi:hypothetical protein
VLRGICGPNREHNRDRVIKFRMRMIVVVEPMREMIYKNTMPLERLKETDYLGELGVDRRMLLKLMSEK